MGRKSGVKVGGIFTVECYGGDGRFKWKEVFGNLVTNVGLAHIVDILFAGSATVDPWYVGLTDGTPTVAAGDTHASHGGWVEVVAYDEANRQTFVDVKSGQSVNNTASKAAFTMSSTSTVGGAFLAAANNKGSATATVILLCAAAFTEGDRAVVDNDTINVGYTFTAADDGA